MAFSATLHIEGHPKEQDGFNVVSCEFQFVQQLDNNGLPSGMVSGGAIKIELKNVNDYDLMNWMLAPSAKKNGKIVFSSGMTDNQSFQTIKFKNAIMFKFQQTFSTEDEISVMFTLSSQELDISGASFENVWA